MHAIHQQQGVAPPVYQSHATRAPICTHYGRIHLHQHSPTRLCAGIDIRDASTSAGMADLPGPRNAFVAGQEAATRQELFNRISSVYDEASIVCHLPLECFTIVHAHMQLYLCCLPVQSGHGAHVLQQARGMLGAQACCTTTQRTRCQQTLFVTIQTSIWFITFHPAVK